MYIEKVLVSFRNNLVIAITSGKSRKENSSQAANTYYQYFTWTKILKSRNQFMQLTFSMTRSLISHST